jgi:hypothetical protein
MFAEEADGTRPEQAVITPLPIHFYEAPIIYIM